MKMIDIPPTWLVLCLVVAWWVGRLVLIDAGQTVYVLGTVLLWFGLILLAVSVWEFWRARTSVIPRDEPKALITGGIYRFTRNPIYLADALILAGLCLRWGAILALPLVPLFMWWITIRFIRQEELTLSQAFPQHAKVYFVQTRRWI